MDNLTHSITGLAVGELIHRALPTEPDSADQAVRHRLLLVACALASNFPDLDLLLTPLLPAPLGPLLHHRGHTHTLLYAIPQAILLASLLWLLWPSARHLLARSKPARAGLLLALGSGLVLHILMDYLNNYGVHPFHPFDSRWFYGDMVFIIEPLFWVAFGAPMIMAVPHRALKAVLAAALGAVLLFFTWREFLLWPSLAALAVLALLLGALQRKDGERGKLALTLAFAASIAFCAMQGYASQQAKRLVAEYAHSRDRMSNVLDVSLSAFPANPVCWIFVSVETNSHTGVYGLRRGVVSIAPGVVTVADCPAGLSERPGQKKINSTIALLSEQQGDLKTLREASRGNCHLNAWMRFARAPLLSATGATDVRFAASVGGNFTTIRLPDFEKQECPRYIPQWAYPRADLLE
jgi:inner membrane protein